MAVRLVCKNAHALRCSARHMSRVYVPHAHACVCATTCYVTLCTLYADHTAATAQARGPACMRCNCGRTDRAKAEGGGSSQSYSSSELSSSHVGHDGLLPQTSNEVLKQWSQTLDFHRSSNDATLAGHLKLNTLFANGPY